MALAGVLGLTNWYLADIVEPFLFYCRELITETFTDCGFADFDSEEGSPVATTKDANYVHVIETVPFIILANERISKLEVNTMTLS